MHGRWADAIAHLEKTRPLLPRGRSRWYRAHTTLAKAMNALGKRDGAIRLLERASEEPVLESGEAPLAWLKMRRQLAGLYRETAQVERALTIDAQVAALMAAADAVSSAGR